jgi:hypothetical protein
MPRVYKEGNWSKNSGSWKGAGIQGGLEPGTRGIAIVEAVTRQLLVKTLQAGKHIACVAVNCKLWKLPMAL